MFTTLAMIVLLFVAAISLFIQFFYIVFGGYTPFFPTKKKVIERVMKEIQFNDDATVYELGCGDAPFLRMAEEKFPKIKELIGIELFMFPYIMARIQTSLKKSRIKILKKNFFDVSLKDADIIYCFLNKPTMKALKEKLIKECKAGTQIVSYQFTLPDLTPIKKIDINEDKKDNIYFYKL